MPPSGTHLYLGQQPPRGGAGFRVELRDGAEDVPVIAASGVYADSVAEEAKKSAPAGDRCDARNQPDSTGKVAACGKLVLRTVARRARLCRRP